MGKALENIILILVAVIGVNLIFVAKFGFQLFGAAMIGGEFVYLTMKGFTELEGGNDNNGS